MSELKAQHIVYATVEYDDGTRDSGNDFDVYGKDEVDAAIKELKRALWLARAERALEKIAWFKLWNASISTMNPEDGARQEYDKWKKSLGKFLKKAEEYR